jgi:hypothetical protein
MVTNRRGSAIISSDRDTNFQIRQKVIMSDVEGDSALANAIAAVFNLVTIAIARATKQAVTEVRAEMSAAKSLPPELTGVDLLDYVRWGGDGGRHCD